MWGYASQRLLPHNSEKPPIRWNRGDFCRILLFVWLPRNGPFVTWNQIVEKGCFKTTKTTSPGRVAFFDGIWRSLSHLVVLLRKWPFSPEWGFPIVIKYFFQKLYHPTYSECGTNFLVHTSCGYSFMVFPSTGVQSFCSHTSSSVPPPPHSHIHLL